MVVLTVWSPFSQFIILVCCVPASCHPSFHATFFHLQFSRALSLLSFLSVCFCFWRLFRVPAFPASAVSFPAFPASLARVPLQSSRALNASPLLTAFHSLHPSALVATVPVMHRIASAFRSRSTEAHRASPCVPPWTPSASSTGLTRSQAYCPAGRPSSMAGKPPRYGQTLRSAALKSACERTSTDGLARGAALASRPGGRGNGVRPLDSSAGERNRVLCGRGCVAVAGRGAGSLGGLPPVMLVVAGTYWN